ncbi:MAG: formate--phosphoribosylaminoimidazolecarboxamide ligase [bacterium]|nr:formate--phosphoribosylaminoimidazolecarboxamide ligase [bacterium]
MKKQYTIATLGSHSALQILKGAKDEGFNTLLITTQERVSLYKRFPFIDEIKIIKNYLEFPTLENELRQKNTIIITHGSFVAYLGIEGNKKITIPYFGSKKVLDWESSRIKQHKWLKEAKVNEPEQYENLNEVEYPVILKLFGASGGKGYLYAKNRKELNSQIKLMKKERFIIQRYIIGVPIFIQFFCSPITGKIELMGIDRRYETNVDAIGRLPLANQKGLTIEPSFVVVGNSPLMLRESLLPEAYKMAERVIEASKKLIDPKGLYGPFCLETIVTPDQKFHVIELSTRIVAGTFLFQNGSPYTWLLYDEPMSMGRRIAREIKIAIKENKLEKIID